MGQGATVAVGVDIGGTKLLALRVEPDGTVTSDVAQASPKDGPDLLREVLAAYHRLCGGRPGSLGIGVPGLVDSSDHILFTPNLAGIAGFSLGAELRSSLAGADLWIGNDATAACWAEHSLGAGRGYRDMLMVTLGTGIGGGVVVDGRLYEGSHRFAGEFGHMVVDPNGQRCPCGKRGCWERYASGAGLGLLGREQAVAGEAPRLVELAGDAELVRGEHVTRAAEEGDPGALGIMDRFGWWVALGLANLANLFDPEVIVVGGGLVAAGEILLEPTRRAFAELFEASSLRPEVEILAATMGPQSGAMGAAILAASTDI